MMALTTIGRRLGTPISRCGGDLTIAEMLSDSIVQALMEADGIDPEMLKELLRNVAEQISLARRQD